MTNEANPQSYWNGHPILYINNVWVYADTKKSVEHSDERPCKKCNKLPVNEHDACIANLPGVSNACCGHGTQDGYVQFMNGEIIRGKFDVR